MKTHICPTCGCSLVRLGISSDAAPIHQQNGEERYFCCQERLDLFATDPEKCLKETSDLVVYPSCLTDHFFFCYYKYPTFT